MLITKQRIQFIQECRVANRKIDQIREARWLKEFYSYMEWYLALPWYRRWIYDSFDTPGDYRQSLRNGATHERYKAYSIDECLEEARESILAMYMAARSYDDPNTAPKEVSLSHEDYQPFVAVEAYAQEYLV